MTELEKGHIVKRFDGELSHLHTLIMEMGNLVLEQIDRAVDTLSCEDVDAAQQVIDRDAKVDTANEQIDEEIVRILARRQPVAVDLRELIAIAKSVTDLERIGDLCRKVAGLTIKIYGKGDQAVPNSRLLNDIPYLAGRSSQMLRKSLDAFDRMELARALEVIEQDQHMESELEDALRRLTTYVLQDARSIGHAIDTVLALRAVERMGGHAKNIAEYVIYLGTGRDVRFLDMSSLRREVLSRLQKA